MLPYFTYTEEVKSFCEFMGYTVDNDVSLNSYVCMYSLEYMPTPYITGYNMDLNASPLIPPEKVIDFLVLMLNGYRYAKAAKEIGVVGNGRPASS